MELYRLDTLIFFLKTQSEMGFQGILQILAIIDQDKIPYARRRKALISILRSYGLNESTHKKGIFAWGEEPLSKEKPFQNNNAENTVPVVTQTFNLKLLNGLLELPVPLN